MESHKNIKTFLWNDFGALKIFFTTLCSGLIFHISFEYLVEKPTLTSTRKTFFTAKLFPVITLCHHDQIDKKSLESEGFRNSYFYRTGEGDITSRNDTHQRISWNGNGTNSVYEVHDKITLLRTPIDCPNNSYFWFERKRNDLVENVVEMKPLSFNLTRVLYPNHMCCKVNIPDLKEENLIKAISITTLNSNENFMSYKLYLSDQISDSPFTLTEKFNLGDEIIINKNEIGWHKNYKVKMSQEHHVEGDPKYHCIKYHQHGEYGGCLEKKMIEIVIKKFNCTPPWVTDNKVTN